MVPPKVSGLLLNLVSYESGGDNDAVFGENKFVSLNTGNRDIGSDYINQDVDTREIILCVKPDLLSRLNSVAAGSA